MTEAPTWRFRGGGLSLERPRIMGIVNVTPDSFSDGGRFLDPAAAVAQAARLAGEGADILDVGGESTRPGSEPVSEREELRRVIPVIREAATLGLVVSVDTSKPRVAAEALAAGAAVINDVTALADPAMAPVVAEAGAGLVLMHMSGVPRNMQDAPRYRDLLVEVCAFLQERRGRALGAGIPAEHLLLDPGIGFGKTLEHNLELLARLGEIAALGSPVLVGASRKRFLGAITGAERPGDRLAGSVAAALAARLAGASVLRVHDVAATREALAVFEAVRRAAHG